jgi:hypothetical protein
MLSRVAANTTLYSLLVLPDRAHTNQRHTTLEASFLIITPLMRFSDLEAVIYGFITAFPSRAPVFTPGFWWVRVAHLFSFLCCVVFLCFVCLRPGSSVLSVSLDCSFLIAPSVFSNILLNKCLNRLRTEFIFVYEDVPSWKVVS